MTMMSGDRSSFGAMCSRRQPLHWLTAVVTLFAAPGGVVASWDGHYAPATYHQPGPGANGLYPYQPPPPTYNPANQQVQHVATFSDLLRGMTALDIAIKFVAPVLETVVDTNERLKHAKVQHSSKASVFRAEKPPTVSIRQYIERIVRLSSCSPECLIMALVYLDRVVAREYTNALTVHRLLLAAIMVATRNRDSTKTWSYEMYRKISGLDINELKVLEKNMIEALNYNVDVSAQELFDYGRKTVGWRKQEMFRPENP